MQTIKLTDYDNFIISEAIATKVLKYYEYEQIDGIFLHSFKNNKTNKITIELILALEYFRKDGTIINDDTKFKEEEIIPLNNNDIVLKVTEANAIDFTYSMMNSIEILNGINASESILLKDSKVNDNYYTNYIQSMKKYFKPLENSITYEPALNIPKNKVKKQY